MIFNQDLNLTLGEKVGPIPLAGSDGIGWDAVSVQTHNPGAATFDSGVVTLKKSNIPDYATAVDLNVTPVTITAPGVKELAIADYGKAAFLWLDVTTQAASNATRIKVAVSLKRLGFSLT